MTAVESGSTMRRSESTVVVEIARPRSTSPARAPASNCQTWRSDGSDAHAEPTVMMPCSSSTTTATQPASWRIQATCSCDEAG